MTRSVYEMMAAPPLLVGAFQCTVTELEAVVIDVITGAPGRLAVRICDMETTGEEPSPSLAIDWTTT
jgi:hypothetical protein